MNMKSFCLALLLYSLISICQAQISVHIGQDISMCRNKWGVIDTMQLAPAVIGNIGSYHCKWDFLYEVEHGLGIYIYGGMVLDDTLSCNPKIVYPDILPNNVWLPLYLTITDSTGAIARDSIHIRFSWFSYLPDLTERTIHLHDSLYINALSFGGIPPVHFSWSPTIGMRFADTLGGGYVSPTQTTIYTCIVTDSLGCVSDWGDVWTITVDTLSGIGEVKNNELNISPNPVFDRLHLDFDLHDMDATIYDVTGRDYPAMLTQHEIDVSALPAGVYCLRLGSKEGEIVRRFLKN